MHLRGALKLPLAVIVALLLGAAGSMAADPPLAFSSIARVEPLPLSGAEAVAVDLEGVLYVADTRNHRILARALDGSVRLLAGGGKAGFADGSGTAAQFDSPAGITFDRWRKVLYVSDTGNNAIRGISLAGDVITIAGQRKPGFADGFATDASFHEPRGLVVDQDGTIFVADALNNAIRAVTPGGRVSLVANERGTPGLADGPASSAQFHQPWGVAILHRSPSESLVLVADRLNHAVRAIEMSTRTVTTLAGGARPGFVDGPAIAALFSEPTSVAAWGETVWIADRGNHALRAISLVQSRVATVAGGGKPGDAVGPLNAAAFKFPTGVAFEGALWVADSGNDAVKVTFPLPTLASVTPAEGDQAGGTRVTVTGSGFVPGARVAFGTRPGTTAYRSPTTLESLTPSGNGLVDVTVATPEGTAVLSSAYRYGPSLVSLAIDPATVTLAPDQQVSIRAVAGFSDDSALDVTHLASWESSDPAVAEILGAGSLRALANGAAWVTARHLGFVASASVTVADDELLPPDGEVQATLIDPTVVTEIADSTRFLYEGPAAVQHGVAPGTIDDVRVAIVRGRVLDRSDAPLGGVRVEVLAEKALGWTTTRSSGLYEIAVNGGGRVTITFAKEGFLPVHRQVETPWRDFAIVEDVVLTRLDPVVTTVAMGAAAPQSAAGSPVEDDDGARTAALFVPAATAAELVLPDGSRVSASTLSIRATEYSVGPNGITAMPAQLPPNSGYTYCVELSADEATAAGAVSVELSQPMLFFLENFLGFPVGTPVPAGYYDRTRGEWIASENGRVIRVVAVEGGAAALDIDGDGGADPASALSLLGITTDERTFLGSRYAAGTSLWRSPVRHFTPWDFNWPYGPPSGAVQPALPPCDPKDPQSPCANTTGGSVIECENQTLGEIVPIEGTPWSLVYRSDRVPGRTGASSLGIPVSTSSVPSGVKRIEVDIDVAGRRFAREFDPRPNQSFVWTWDGRDAWGRELRGRYPVRVRRSYVYDAVYQRPGEFDASFAELSGVPITADRARQEVRLSQEWQGALGAFSADAAAMGSWSFDVQHHFDSTTRELHLGAGGALGRPETGVFRTVMKKVFGGSNVFNVATAPDGALYYTRSGKVWRIDRDGTETHVAGDGGWQGYNGDGIPAKSATLQLPTAIAVGSDGSIFVAEDTGYRVRRIDPNGIIWTVAGTGRPTGDPLHGEGGPATEADLTGVFSLAMGPDGSLYLGMALAIRRVSPGGTMTTVAGAPDATALGDGGPARRARVGFVYGLAVAKDGALVFSDTYAHRIRRIGTNGVVRTIAGDGGQLSKWLQAIDIAADSPPLASSLDHPTGVTIGADGSVYFLDRNCFYPCWVGSPNSYRGVVRRVTPDGVLSLVAGRIGSMTGDETTPDSFEFPSSRSIAAAPDGGTYIVGWSDIRKLQPAYPGFRSGTTMLPSRSGETYHAFDRSGRHLATNDVATGLGRASFSYDAEGRLIAIADENGRVTTIERSGGMATKIVAPGGKETSLGWDGNGYLASVTAPGGLATRFSYAASGLLRSMTDPRGNRTTFDYDSAGRLIRDTDAEGGAKSLTFSGSTGAYEVAVRDGAGRVTTYAIEGLGDGSERQIVRDAAGLVTSTVRRTSESVTNNPDGSRLTLTTRPDALFGLLAPRNSREVATPGGRRLTLSSWRSVSGSGPGALERMVENIVVNSARWTIEHEVAARRRTTLSPMGRFTEETLTATGRLAKLRVSGVASTTFAYDGRGRLTGIAQSAEGFRFGWNDRDELATITDPLGRSVGFTYDDGGRVTAQRLPDGRIIIFGWDANGNLTSLTPPGRPAHGFGYSGADLETAYDPPPVSGSGGTSTRYEYNLARDLTKVIRPDGLEIGLAYDSGGRLATVTTPIGPYRYSYRGDGNLGSIAAPGGMMLTYGWDGFLPVSVQWSGEIAGEVVWTYDDFFRVASESVNGVAVTFGYDADSMLVRAGAMTIQRDPANGRITGTALGRMVDRYEYDADGRVSLYVMEDGTSEVLRLEYDRDAVGRITDKRESRYGVTLVERYEYDTAGRLRQVFRNGALAATYTYDANGNRLAKTTPLGVETGTYDDQDRMLTYAGATYTYTANGEMRTKTDSSGTTTYDYDVFGNLRRVEMPEGTVIEYVIDGQNRRVGKKVNGVLERAWLYTDQFNPIAELDGTGTVVSRFVYATRTSVPDYMIRGGITYRFVGDHLGSVIYVLDSTTGSIAEMMSYNDPFGSVNYNTNSAFEPFSFGGGMKDPDTGFIRFGARDYDPSTARWMAKDPILFHGGDLNLFGYVANDPVNLTDQTGLTIRRCFRPLRSWRLKALTGAVSTLPIYPLLQPPVPGVRGSLAHEYLYNTELQESQGFDPREDQPETGRGICYDLPEPVGQCVWDEFRATAGPPEDYDFLKNNCQTTINETVKKCRKRYQ